MKALLLAGSAMCVFAMPVLAHAEAGEQPQASSGSATASQPGAALEEIVVTAQRREERQQSVPIAISAISGAQAAKTGVTGTESLSIAVPSLQFTRQVANGAAPFVRGIGSTTAAAGFESPVAVYIDDVYIGSPAAALLAFNNINRIEVLKGPQGTLFGRNATGGVIHIHTLEPSDTPKMDAQVGYGNFNTWDGSFYASGPLSSTLSGNVAAIVHDQKKGYGTDLATNQDIHKSRYSGLRSELLWKPDGDTRVRVSGDYSTSHGDDGLNAAIFPGAIATGGTVNVGKYNTLATNNEFNTADDGKGHQWGGSLRVDRDLGSVKLVSITAYRKNYYYYFLDNDSSRANLLANRSTIEGRTFSQEVQLQGPTTGAFSWIVGGFYYHSKVGYLPVDYAGSFQGAYGGLLRTTGTVDLDSYSAFADANYQITPTTKLTAGIRYTSDRPTENVVLTNASGVVQAPGAFEQDDKFSKVTWRAVLDQKIGENVLVYGSYSRGFKSGGYNLAGAVLGSGATAVPAPAVSPEIIDAFEVGLKSDLLDRRLRFNAAAFYYDYSNLQVTTVQTGVPVVLNAAGAHIKGIDADIEAAVSSRLRLTVGVAMLDSKFVSFPAGPFTLPNPASCVTLNTTGAATGGNATCYANLSGNTTPRAPKFTGNITATYTLPTDVGDFVFTGSIYRNSGFVWDADNRLRQPDYTLVNGTVTWRSTNGKYDVSVWGRNLGDAYYYSFATAASTRDSGSPAMPRSFGATLGVHF
jgi:iron complex outermembrane receptor protein